MGESFYFKIILPFAPSHPPDSRTCRGESDIIFFVKNCHFLTVSFINIDFFVFFYIKFSENWFFDILGDVMDLLSTLKEKAPADVFTDLFLKNLIPSTDNRRFGLVKRWIKKGEIIQLKQGIYLLVEKNRKRGVNLFQIAQILYEPSYISLESALSYHGWIPEAVLSILTAIKSPFSLTLDF